jgi:glycogen synthase
VFHYSGPGDAIGAHHHWKRGEPHPREIAITFTSQIEQYCRDVGARLYIVSSNPRRDLLRDGPVRIEHLPKPMASAGGALHFYLREALYGFMLLARALRFGADAAILDSGSTLFPVQALFALVGIRVVPVLHNALWPAGYPPTRAIPRLLLRLDRYFWRYAPQGIVCVSPECERQVQTVAGGTARPLVQVRAQFLPEYFRKIPPPPPHGRRPFRILFVGRITQAKGVFDLLEMASTIESRAPGRVRWDVYGAGEALEELKRRRTSMGLEGVVNLRGWASLENLHQVYGEIHATIVPTRSSFGEGMAMTAAEAILAGRPIITNPVVPALEVLRPAAVPASTDRPDTYVAQILRLIDDQKWYDSMVRACPDVAAPFLDRDHGMTSVLKKVLGTRRQ